jgi:hypothetical protein
MNYFKISLQLLIIMAGIVLNADAKASDQAMSPEVREQHIQKASQLRKLEDYGAAIMQLDSILLYQPTDAPILLFKGDLQLQSRLFSAAAGTYKQLLLLNYEQTITKINLSYALFMGHQPVNALFYAKDAWETSKTNTNAVVNYFNALLWNMKTNEAADFLKQQKLSASQMLVLQARLFTTSGNYTKGLHYYDSLVTSYPDKYYIQEYAEVLLGKKEMLLSSQTMKSGEHYFTANEYQSFTRKLKAARLQYAGTELVYFSDVAKNTRVENIAFWQQGDGQTYRFAIKAGISTITSAQNEKTNAQFANVNINERWSKAWSGQTEVFIQRIQPGLDPAFSAILGKQTVQYQPNDRRMFGLSYSTDILNYTAALFGKNIRSNNFGYVTHLLLTGKTGVYSQGSFGSLTDNNQKFQFFGSLYHLFRTEPTLKAGLNLSVLHFTDNAVKNYFSPDQYLSTEIFTDYSTALPNLSKFYLQVQAAAGIQKIEQENWQPAFRLQTELGLRLTNFETSLKYQSGNVSASSGTGYQYKQIVCRLAWKW